MSRFIYRDYFGDEECSFERVIPIEYPTGIVGFLLDLFEEAERNHAIYEKERRESSPSNWQHFEFTFMGITWVTPTLIGPNGEWFTDTVELLTIDAWFSERENAIKT